MATNRFEGMLDSCLAVPFSQRHQQQGLKDEDNDGAKQEDEEEDEDDDFSWSEDDDGASSKLSRRPDQPPPQPQLRGRKLGPEVEYVRFEAAYWPRLNAERRRGLEASLVWTEVQSCLKGGVEALATPKGRLDVAAYTALAST